MSDLIGWLEAAERRAGVTERGAEAARSTTTVVPTYPHELGAEPPATVAVSSPVVTAGLSTSAPAGPPLRRPPTCWRSRWWWPPDCCASRGVEWLAGSDRSEVAEPDREVPALGRLWCQLG
jgi:hypothetical protein